MELDEDPLIKLDLSDLDQWEDEEVAEALEEIDQGLTLHQIEWVQCLAEFLRDQGPWSELQRETAENILREWNDD